MSEWRRYGKARRDDSEPEVIEGFEDGPVSATCVQHSGKDENDLFVAYRGRWHAVEVKTGNRKRTRAQLDWAKKQAAPVHEARTRAQARALKARWDLEFAEAQQHAPNLEDDQSKFFDPESPEDL